MDLRYRIEHGDEKVHLIFAKSRVVVYIDDGEIDNSPDVQLQKDGWTVLHYVTDNITDGYAEAEEIKNAVKASLRAISKSKKK